MYTRAFPISHYPYYIKWIPKYRYRVLTGEIKRDVKNLIRAFSHQEKCEIIELNVQIDHIHLLVMIPPKISISSYVGKFKGRAAIRILNKFKNFKQKKYWENHFWARGYCVDTVGLDSKMIRQYVKSIKRRMKRKLNSKISCIATYP